MAYCEDKDMVGDVDATKCAQKGVSKRHNKYSYENFKECLYKDKVFEATNYTIREHAGAIRTMKCRKRGLTGTHVKNLVLDDRVTVVPHKRHRSNL